MKKAIINIITVAAILLLSQSAFSQVTVKAAGRTVKLSVKQVTKIKASHSRLAIAALTNAGANGTIQNNEAADAILNIIAIKKGLKTPLMSAI